MHRAVLVFLSVMLLVGAVPALSGYDNVILSAVDGKQVEVDSLLAQGPVVLNFWATWCRPCRQEMPHLEKIRKDLDGKGVYFAAVSLDARNRSGSVEEFVKKLPVTLPVYRDPDGIIAKRFKVTAIPTTIVLDRSAEIYFRTRGYRPGDEILLKKKLEALIKPGAEDEAAGPDRSSE